MLWVTGLLCGGLAWAQDEELVVEAEQTVEATRRELDETIRELGYLRPIQLGDTSRYLHPQPWRPRVLVHDDGLIEVRTFRRTPMMIGALQPRAPDTPQPLTLNEDLEWQRPTGTGGVSGVWSSRRTVQRMESDVLTALVGDVRAWQGAIRA